MLNLNTIDCPINAFSYLNALSICPKETPLPCFTEGIRWGDQKEETG